MGYTRGRIERCHR